MRSLICSWIFKASLQDDNHEDIEKLTSWTTLTKLFASETILVKHLKIRFIWSVINWYICDNQGNRRENNMKQNGIPYRSENVKTDSKKKTHIGIQNFRWPTRWPLVPAIPWLGSQAGPSCLPWHGFFAAAWRKTDGYSPPFHYVVLLKRKN